MQLNVLSYLQGACAFLVSIVVSIPACHAGDRGSIPRRGDSFFIAWRQMRAAVIIYIKYKKKKTALAGNRTRASRVAGENSTTEPPMLAWRLLKAYCRSHAHQ